MYCYIYDSFLQKKKFKAIIDKIESKLLDLGISGTKYQLNVLQNVNELVKEAIFSGVKNIIAVGSDETLSKVLNAIGEKEVVLGYIPVKNSGFNYKIAEILGIPFDELACDVVSRRIIYKFDIGKANGQYFLFELSIKDKNIEILGSKGYKIIPLQDDTEVHILNFNTLSIEKKISPYDGIFELILVPNIKKFFLKKFLKKTNLPKYTIIPIEKLKLDSIDKDYSIPVFLDGFRVIKTPIKVEVIPEKISIIVGKERKL